MEWRGCLHRLDFSPNSAIFYSWLLLSASAPGQAGSETAQRLQWLGIAARLLVVDLYTLKGKGEKTGREVNGHSHRMMFCSLQYLWLDSESRAERRNFSMDSAIAPDRHSAAAERVDSSSVLVAKVSSKQVLKPSCLVLLAAAGSSNSGASCRSAQLCQCGSLAAPSRRSRRSDSD